MGESNTPEPDEVETDELSVADVDESPDIEAEGTDDEGEIRTLADLAEANGWDAEELYALEMAMPDSDTPIPLGKLKDEITTGRRERESLQQSVQEQARQLEMVQAQAQNNAMADQQMVNMQGQINVLGGFLQSPEFEALKKQDPGAAALKSQEVQQHMGNLSNQMQQYQYQMQQQQSYAQQQTLEGGQQYLHQAIPEWSNPEVESAEKLEIAHAFIDSGYNQNDVAAMADPRAVMMVRELVQLRKQLGAGKKAVTQVRQSEKRSLRGGKLHKVSNKSNLVKRAKTTGSRNDVTAAAKAILFGG